MSKVDDWPGTYPGFCSIKRPGVFLTPPPLLDGILVHHRATPRIKFAGVDLYTRVERGTVRVNCLAEEHSTMSLGRSGVERTNHEATAPHFCISFHAVTFLFFLLPVWSHHS